uniref:Uncharacterized protein n=1 Tax=Anopheles melas TaxID=34690 RepID=A0A182THN6_9DIPT
MPNATPSFRFSDLSRSRDSRSSRRSRKFDAELPRTRPKFSGGKAVRRFISRLLRSTLRDRPPPLASELLLNVSEPLPSSDRPISTASALRLFARSMPDTNRSDLP